MSSEFEDRVRRLAAERRRALAMMAGGSDAVAKPPVPNITRPPQAYAPPAYTPVPNVIRPLGSEAPISLPQEPVRDPSPGRMPMAELQYLRNQPMIGQDMRASAQAATDQARTLKRVGPVAFAGQGGYTPPPSTPKPPASRPTMTMMGEDAPPAAAPQSAPAPQGPTREAQIWRLVNAGMDPTEAARIVDRRTEVSGPLPAGLWAQYNSPDAIRALKARVQEQKQREAKQDAFADEYNFVTGAPNAKEPDSWSEGDGDMARAPTPGSSAAVLANREAAEAADWEARGTQMADRRKFDEQIRARELSRLEALPPEERELRDYRKQVGLAWGKYKRDISNSQKAGQSFGDYLAERGLAPQMVPVVDQDGQPVLDSNGKPQMTPKQGHMAIANHYLKLEHGKFEQEKLREQRRERVRTVGMNRAGNGYLGPDEVLDDPTKSYEQRMAAYTKLARLNPARAEYYNNMAALETSRLAEREKAQAAKALKEFDKKPWPKEPTPDVNANEVVVDIMGSAPPGSSRHSIITATAARMPGETAGEREAAAANAVDAHLWGTAASGVLPENSWMRGHMQSLIYPADDKGTPSDKPITLQQFATIAAQNDIGPRAAKAIYQNIVTGAVPGEVPNNHAPVGVPDTDVAAAG